MCRHSQVVTAVRYRHLGLGRISGEVVGILFKFYQTALHRKAWNLIYISSLLIHTILVLQNSLQISSIRKGLFVVLEKFWGDEF